MSDDYLWDKSGEPDPEIEELEQVLESLRYRRPPGGLPLPQRAPIHQRRNFRPALAIAAAALFMMIAAGVWFSLGLRGQRESLGIAAVNIQVGSAQDWINPDSLSVNNVLIVDDGTKRPEHLLAATGGSRPDGTHRLPDFKRRQPSDVQTATLSSVNRRERISNDEGIAAKEQLIKALHLASSKLNLVQKKVQDSKAIGPES